MSASVHLYDLSAELRRLQDLAGDEGELTPEFEADLERLAPKIDQKIDAICAFNANDEVQVGSIDGQIAAVMAQVDRLKKAKSVVQNKIKSRKDYLKRCFDLAGTRKHKTGLWTVWIQANPPSADCLVDPAALDPAYQRVKTIVEPDRVKAIEQFKATGTAPAGFEVSQTEGIRVK